MRKLVRVGIAAAVVLAIPAGALSASGTSTSSEPQARPHDLGSPLSDEQRELRQQALEMKLAGKIAAGAKVGKVAKGQYVELAREGEESILTMLGEFDDLGNNEIPEPDRNVDNTTIWTENFDRQHYLDLLFSEARGAVSMRNFYIEQSSNRYTVNGDVTDWATTPQGAVYYNDDGNQPNVCADQEGNGTWAFLRDTAQSWWDGQIASGKTAAELNAYLSKYDVWDRYDWDGDSNFDEPDGYIDHFQAVHAGMGEEVGGGVLGGNAIWSHRWYACYGLIGETGPSPEYELGGLQIGDSNYWIGDYTVEPENGGVGVFAHEYAHDLGIPDLYDTAGGENSTGFWTLMSSGSYGNDGTEDIGSKPIHMGAWEKFQLGWLNYEVAFAGQKSEHKLGPAETNTKQAQGVFVVLPKKSVTVNLGPPYAGTKFYYSGAGDNIDNTMTKAASGSSLTAKVRYDIEVDWDYAYLRASADGGATWANVQTNLSTNTNPNGQNFGNGITGASSGWVDLTAALPAGTNAIQFRYWTDGAVVRPGFQIDEISIDGGAPDGAETDAGWTFRGFRTTTGVETRLYNNYYVIENRQYTGYDDSLRTGPYNFGFLNTRPSWVERFSYQDGVLISYWDTSYTNNNTSEHPGGGLILPIDAHPEPLLRPNGSVWRSRVQAYDSTFGLQPTDAITLHVSGVASPQPSLPAVPVFDDRNQHWRAATPLAGVKNPDTGTQVRVKSITPGGFAQVEVSPAK